MSEKPLSSFELTVGKQPTPKFKPPRSHLRWVGVLTPTAGKAAAPIRVEGRELILGRGEDCGAILLEASVSRRHARITRDGDEFTLEDLNSYNGTHVDGIPILSCVLHDGDTVQFGQNRYRFERQPEPVAPEKQP